MCTCSPSAVPPLLGFLLALHCMLSVHLFRVSAPPLSVLLLTHFHTEKHCPKTSLRKYAAVCKLNSLMTFSLEELTAKCCLRLPKGRPAWLRVALLYMKYCFQATATGSCFTPGERERETNASERTEQSSDTKTHGISHPKFPSPQGLVPHGCHVVGKAEAGPGSLGEEQPNWGGWIPEQLCCENISCENAQARETRSSSSSLAGMDFICLAHPFQEQASKWTSCCWRLLMRQCTSAAANGQRIFYSELFPWLSEYTPTWIPPAFSYFLFLIS